MLAAVSAPIIESPTSNLISEGRYPMTSYSGQGPAKTAGNEPVEVERLGLRHEKNGLKQKAGVHSLVKEREAVRSLSRSSTLTFSGSRSFIGCTALTHSLSRTQLPLLPPRTHRAPPQRLPHEPLGVHLFLPLRCVAPTHRSPHPTPPRPEAGRASPELPQHDGNVAVPALALALQQMKRLVPQRGQLRLSFS